MANPNLRKPAPPDAPEPVETVRVNDPRTPKDRIEPDRMKQWAKRLNVSTARLREAVQRAGPAAEDVRPFLAYH